MVMMMLITDGGTYPKGQALVLLYLMPILSVLACSPKAHIVYLHPGFAYRFSRLTWLRGVQRQGSRAALEILSEVLKTFHF
jgi:hypothetical protein